MQMACRVSGKLEKVIGLRGTAGRWQQVKAMKQPGTGRQKRTRAAGSTGWV
jgi:hypothetical protein